MRADKGECDLTLSEVAEHAEGIAFIAWPGEDLDAFEAALPRAARGLAVDCAMSRRRMALSRRRHWRGSSGSTGWRGRTAARILATNDVHYHAPERRPLQDVMTCIREKVTIADARAICSTPMPSGI